MQTVASRRPGIRPAKLVLFAMVILGASVSTQAQNASSITANAPQPIYSKNIDDPWNRIFHALFSRRIKFHLSDQFPDGAPFIEQSFGSPMLDPGIHISTKVFEREETGDHAIDPFYPYSMGSSGRRVVLTAPLYSEFAKALQEALEERAVRSVVARALMQSDLWAAYDILYHPLSRSSPPELEQHRRELLDLLGRLIKKIALTPQEIKTLPDNYSSSMQQNPLPDVFRKAGGWIEVQWFPQRMHDDAADYRRASRVFLKPTHPARDVDKFLNTRPDLSSTPATDLDGVALVIQLILINSQGKLETTRLTTDVQIRLFQSESPGKQPTTRAQMYEISRKLFLQHDGSGSLVREEETSPAFLPSAGNDYGFASSQMDAEGLPIQVQLRTRCGFCHGSNLTQVMTFNIARPPNSLTPRVRQLDPTAHEAADFDVSQKEKREDFQSLRKYFSEANRHSE